MPAKVMFFFIIAEKLQLAVSDMSVFQLADQIPEGMMPTGAETLGAGASSFLQTLLLTIAAAVLVRMAAKEGLKSDIAEMAMNWGGKLGGLINKGLRSAPVGLGMAAWRGVKSATTQEGHKKWAGVLKPGVKGVLADKAASQAEHQQKVDRINTLHRTGGIGKDERDRRIADLDREQAAKIKSFDDDVQARRDKRKETLKSALRQPLFSVGKAWATDGAAVDGAKKVWGAWKDNMAGMKESDALKWGQRFANAGKLDITGGLEGSGFDVDGIKKGLQLKLDLEITKGVDDKYRDLLNYGTRQQLVAEAKKLEGDAAKGDRGAQIAMEKMLHTIEQKHITFFRADEPEARDLMGMYEKIIKNQEAGKTNMVRDSFANSTGDRLGTMGAKNPVFSGAIIRDGVGKGFLEDASGNRIWLHEHPDRKTSVNLKKVDLNYLKGSNGPSMLKAIAEGKVDTQHQLSDSILRAILDEEQRSVHQISDDLVEALQKMKGVDRFRGQIEGVEKKISDEKAKRDKGAGGDSGSSGLVDAHGRPIS